MILREPALADLFARFFTRIDNGLYIGTLTRDHTATVAANAALKRILGYPAAAPDAGVLPFAPERFADPASRTAFVDRLEADGRVIDYPLQIRRLDDRPVWVEITAAFDAPDLFASMRDVSDRRLRDDRSRDLSHQLLQAEKMAALGQTISGVAHELNNPLATILSWAERLAEHPADDRARRGLDVILSESERAARIVRNLLTFARKRQSTRMLMDLNEVARDTLALRSDEQRTSNIAVVLELADGLPDVFADVYQVKQVILNLLINAEQAILSARAGGTVTVRTEHDRDRRAAVLEVHDNGPGIASDLQGKIFDPFYTTKEVGKGTGLGLSVAYGIVQEHGGRIWVASEAGKGASFFIELPLAEAWAEQASPPGRAQVPGAAAPPRAADPALYEAFKGLRVLVVEDEPALGTAVAEALADAGFLVERAGDGEEGLTLVGHHHYDLIVCDLKMPKIDGIQFYRAMAAATPALARRVIFVTGAVAGTDAERFLEETGCRWLAKPFRLGDLLRAARDTLS